MGRSANEPWWRGAVFGGEGLLLDVPKFALIASDTHFLKVDDGNRDRYLDAGPEPFRPSEGRPTTMSCLPVPEQVFEDEAGFVAWAREAYAAALRGRGSQKSRPGRGGEKGRSAAARGRPSERKRSA